MNKFNYWVKDYEEAKNWFVEKLDWVCVKDMKYSETGRWIVVGPKGDNTGLTFSLAISEEKKKLVGSQAADHVFGVLDSDNIERDYNKMKENGVKFHYESIKTNFWGKDALFEDLYGNKWDLVETQDKKYFPKDSPPPCMISLMSLLVKDFDEAKAWYVNKLGFKALSDNTYGDFRWLELGPCETYPAFTLHKATAELEELRIGSQSFLLNVDDLDKFYKNGESNGVTFTSKPKQGYGGIDAQFVDLYGNAWNVRQTTAFEKTHDKKFENTSVPKKID